MRKLCVIPCGRSKIWGKHPEIGPTPAKNVYTGSFHKKCQQYARCFFADWVILSAKYGFLLPNDIVPENYNVCFNQKGPGVITVEDLKEQVVSKGLDQFDVVVVLAGKNYARVIEQSFSSNPTFEYPLKGQKGMGFMMQYMDAAMRNDVM